MALTQTNTQRFCLYLRLLAVINEIFGLSDLLIEKPYMRLCHSYHLLPCTLFIFSESDKSSGKSIKVKLNEALNGKLAEIESKREKAIIREKRIAKLPDGPERRKLIFQKTQEENAAKKKKKDRVVEEQDLHESYQILLGVN